MTYCALCAAPVLEFSLQPLGRDDAMVAVCRKCDDEPARTVDGPDRGYESHPENRGWRNAVKRAADKFAPGRIRERCEVLEQLSPGYILIRVNRRDALGIARDRNEAERAFAAKPWRSEVRYLGPTHLYHLFERPDPMVVEPEDAMAALEPYRVDWR